jgi:hypothetical protein
MQPLTVDELRSVAFAAWKTLHQEQRDLDGYVLAARCVITGASHLASEAENSGESPEGYRTLVRNMTFNIASACWPGWEDAYDTVAPAHLALSLELCRLNIELSDALNSPPAQTGNGYWMLGAHLLANGSWNEAEQAFRTAAELGREAGAQDSALMAEGWILVTQTLAGHDRQAELDGLIEKLKSLGEDGEFYAGQYLPAIQRLAPGAQ